MTGSSWGRPRFSASLPSQAASCSFGASSPGYVAGDAAEVGGRGGGVRRSRTVRRRRGGGGRGLRGAAMNAPESPFFLAPPRPWPP